MAFKPDMAEAVWKSWGMCRLSSPTSESNGHEERQEVTVVSNFDDNDVQQYCRKNNIVAHRLYQIAWAIVLGAYAGTEEITTGMFIQSRSHEPIVYHCRLHGTESAEHLCTKVEEEILEWTTGPKETVRELGSASRSTGLFDTMLSNCDTPSEGQEKGTPMQHLPLCITVLRSHKSIVVNFSRQGLSESQARSIGGCLDKTISQILQHGDKKIEELDIISAADMDQLAEWNQAELHLVESCIHEVIQDQVSRRPKQPAICAWDGNFTYKELDERSNCLARRLRGFGVKKDVIVPFYFRKSAWTVVAILATLKAGGAPVALNADFPEDRLLYIIRFTNAQVITAEKDMPNSIRDAVSHVVIVDHLSTDASESSEPSNILTSSPSPQDISFVVFTSGSTGTPKGIVLDHQSFCSSAMGQIKALNIHENSRVLQFSAHTFDVHLLEIVTSLMAGACVCIPSEDQRMNDLKGAIYKMGVTWAGITPTVAQILSADDVPTLKTLAVWGETSNKDIVDAWADRVELLNVWGPAECSVVSCVHNFSTQSRHPAILGTALQGNHVWIVRPDNWTKLAPLGSVGEAAVQGFSVGNGYLHNAARTKEVFVRLPWVTDQPTNGSSKAYRSGDLVRYTEKGEVQFLGRKDTQVKLRGQRIELEEVEFNINLEAGTDAITVVEVVEPGCLPARQFLAAFQGPLTAIGGRCESEEELTLLPITEEMRIDFLSLKSRISKKLPPFMVPNLYIPLQYIPTLALGKVNRRKIRNLAAGLSKDQVASFTLAPSKAVTTENCVSHLEEQILNLVARVLGLDRNQVSRADNFISLGGNSIRAMQLAATAQKEGLALAVADILGQQPLAALASVATGVNIAEKNVQYTPFMNISDSRDEAVQLTGEIISKLGIGPADVEDIWPATDYQVLHIRTGLAKGRGGTNFLVFDFENPPPLELLQSACRRLAQHHSTLRSVFVVHRRRVLQVALRNFQPDIILHACTKSVEETMTAILEDDKRSSCALGHPIAHFTILYQEKRARRLTLRISHAQYDGVSFFRLCKDIGQLIQGHSLTPAPSFGEYVLYTRQQRKESTAYWSNLLAGAEMTPIVWHHQPSYRNVVNGAINQLITVETDLSRCGITIASAIKASWSVVLAELSGRTDIVFGSTTWGRSTSLENIEQFVGACINQIPVRVSFRPGMSVMNLLEQVQEQQIASAHHEATGIATIVDDCTYWCPWERFSSVVLYQNLGQDGSSFSIDHSRVSVTEIRPPSDRCDIAIYSEPRGHQTFIEINFCEDVISVPTARNILHRLCTVLESFATDVHATLNFPRASPVHQPQLPLEVNGCHGIQTPVSLQEEADISIKHPKRRWNEGLCEESPIEEHREKRAKLAVTLDIDDEVDNDAPRNYQQHENSNSLGLKGNIRMRGLAKEMMLCSRLPCTVYDHVEKAWEAVMDCSRNLFQQYSRNDTPFYEIWGNTIAACGLAEYYNSNLGCQVCLEDIMEYSTPRLQVIFLHEQGNFCGEPSK